MFYKIEHPSDYLHFVEIRMVLKLKLGATTEFRATQGQHMQIG